MTYIDLYRELNDAGVPEDKYRLYDSYGTGRRYMLVKKHDGSYSVVEHKKHLETSKRFETEDDACREMARKLAKYAE